MYVQTIFNLWHMVLFAYALVDSNGNLIENIYPRKLSLNIEAAAERSFSPIIVAQPRYMVESWADFVRYATVPAFSYQNGRVVDENGKILLQDDVGLDKEWIRHLDTRAQLIDAQENGSRFGSGNALSRLDKLFVKREDLTKVSWVV